MFTFGLGPAPRLPQARTRADAPPRFRGNVWRNCVWRLRRVDWARLTCGRTPSTATFAQVKAKREVLAQVNGHVQDSGGVWKWPVQHESTAAEHVYS